ncbi:MAG TPA: hypothetical protein VIG75_12155, partial [Citricoccus sp.]
AGSGDGQAPSGTAPSAPPVDGGTGQTPGFPGGEAGDGSGTADEGTDGQVPPASGEGSGDPEGGAAVGLPPRPPADGPGTDPASDAPEGGDTQAAIDRMALTGMSGWLLGGAGVLLIALVGLALMALPRRRRRH